MLEAVLNDRWSLHYFRQGSVVGDFAEKRLLQTLKNELRLVGTVNRLMEDGVTTYWALLNSNEIVLMLNAAASTCK